MDPENNRTHVINRLMFSNWFSIPHMVLPFSRNVTFLTGANGSGKSTIVDALSLILYGEQKDKLNFTGEKKRDVETAIHWYTPEGVRRSGLTHTYIILEMTDANGLTYHQGIHYRSSGYGSNLSVTYFMGEGSLENIGADDPMRCQAGKVSMQQVFPSKDRAFNAFFDRRGYRESFTYQSGQKSQIELRNMMRSILENSGIQEKTISDYAKTHLFPSSATDPAVSELVSSLHEIDRLDSKIKMRQEEREFLSDIITFGGEKLKAEYARTDADHALAILSFRHYTQEAERQENLAEEYSAKIKVVQAEAEGLKKLFDAKCAELAEFEQSESPTLHAEKALASARAEQERAASLKERYDAFHNARRKLRDLGIALGRDPEADMQKIESFIREMKERAGADAVRAAQIKKEAEETKAALAALEGKGAPAGGGYIADMLSGAKTLKEAIAGRCPKAAPKILFECIDSVLDKGWQEAAERIIGSDRFGIVVPPEYYDEACRIQHGMTGNRRDIIVLNTKRKPHPAGNDVSGLFTYTDRNAERYIQAAYGDCILAETDMEYASAGKALRKNGQFKTRNRSTLPGKQSSSVTLLFGAKAVEEEKERLKKKAAELEKDISSLNKEKQEAEAAGDAARGEGAVLKENAAYADRRYRDAYEAACAALAKAENQLQRAGESEDAKIFREMHDILIKEREELDRQRMEKNGKAALLADKASGSRLRAANSRKSAESMREIVQKTGTESLTEEEEELIAEKGWTVDDMTESRRGELFKQAVSESEEHIRRFETFLNKSHTQEILMRLTRAPMDIRTEKDLEYFIMAKRKLDELILTDADEERIRKCRERKRTGYAAILTAMYNEFREARRRRDEINKVLTKFPIGSCRYRIGKVTVKNSGARVMELAEKLGEGTSLTPEDIDFLDGVCEEQVTMAGKKLITNPFDYKDYIETHIEFTTDDMDSWKRADKQNNVNSTGQQAILRYILKIVVVASQAYTEKNCLRFIMTDEALQGIDDTNKAYFFETIRAMNIQCLISSYNEAFHKDADMSFIFQMDRSDYSVNVSQFEKSKKETV